MKILFINQSFYPDCAATAHYLSDLTAYLAETGHEATVITSRRGFVDPAVTYPAKEVWRGVRVIRLGGFRFGRNSLWRRAAGFSDFLIRCAIRLVLLADFDVVVAMTNPPMAASIAAFFAAWKKTRFLYWVMDLHIEQASTAGYLRDRSAAASVLRAAERYALTRASDIIVLDHFMADRVRSVCAAREHLRVIPPWTQNDAIRYDPAAAARFRAEHGMADDTFVVMYAGNHSPCHPLDTVLDVASRLKDDPRFVFCFVGGGGEFERVRGSDLRNSRCVPYHPIREMSGILSAADAHLVVSGDPYVGIVHPSKIYNIMVVGAPVLYIGPVESHIAELIREQPWGHAFRHGEAAILITCLERLYSAPRRTFAEAEMAAARQYSQAVLLPRMAEVITSRLQPIFPDIRGSERSLQMSLHGRSVPEPGDKKSTRGSAPLYSTGPFLFS